jgi:kynurenine formamidase
MKFSFEHKGRKYAADFNQPIDISIPLRAGDKNVKAFYADDVRIEPMKAGNFVGDVLQGGSCNVNEVSFNPHCNGTHTECVGHISKEKHSLNQCLTQFFFLAELITVVPEEINGDKVITQSQVANSLLVGNALIIRTAPNDKSKLTRNYSGTNPPYIHHDVAAWICKQGIEHLLLDLPSVDKEDDNKLLAHHAFWQYPEKTRTNCTITEFIYMPDSISDGIYLLNLQIASFENDASPSKPVLYRLVS